LSTDSASVVTDAFIKLRKRVDAPGGSFRATKLQLSGRKVPRKTQRGPPSDLPARISVAVSMVVSERKGVISVKAIVIRSNTIEVEREGNNISTWSGLLV
jgi:hypothetical protein